MFVSGELRENKKLIKKLQNIEDGPESLFPLCSMDPVNDNRRRDSIPWITQFGRAIL